MVAAVRLGMDVSMVGRIGTYSHEEEHGKAISIDQG